MSYSSTKVEVDLDESAVRGMYDQYPYPDLGAKLKAPSMFLDDVMPDLTKRGPEINYLEAGCGTGHKVVGVKNKFPNWKCYGVDLSSAAIGIASKLSSKYKAKVEYHTGSYLDPMPYTEKQFDVISALGTIHHTTDPVAAMKAMRSVLKDDGYMFVHLYGWRCDKEKFDIKCMIDLFEPDLKNHHRRFQLYKELVKHKKKRFIWRLANTSLLDIYEKLFLLIRNTKRRLKKLTWSPPWTHKYPEINSPWVDHFCHPCERAYEVDDVQNLIKESGFKVVKMLGQGRIRDRKIPEGWQEEFQKLDEWKKWRLMELMSQKGGAFLLILQKSNR